MRVHSIFQSINGEVTASHQGSVCTFLRLQGCNLRCPFCDTKDSQDPNGGKEMSVEEVKLAIYDLPIKTTNLTITGGEPLLQIKELTEMKSFLVTQFDTTLETNGTMDPSSLFFDSVVMDIKPRGVFGSLKNWDSYLKKALEYATRLDDQDWVKFPILQEEDLIMAIGMKDIIRRKSTVRFAFSAVAPLTPKQLYDWIMERKVTDVILNVQIHKLVGVA